jgi:predicted RNase H-like HicB family nuclease
MEEFKVLWSEEDGEFVGLCSDHPGLSHLAKTEEEALAGILELVEEVKKIGEEILEELKKGEGFAGTNSGTGAGA